MVKAMLAADRDTIKLAQMLAPFLIRAEKDLEYIRAVIEYVLYTKKVDSRDKFIHELTTRLSPTVGEEIMTIAEQLKQEGGMETAERIAAALLCKHQSVDEIAEVTQLPKEKIETLKQKLNC
jgi:hypothetical protein